MAKKILGFVFIAVLLFVLVAAGFFAYKGYQKSQNYKLIDQYLTEKHLKSKIIDEKSDYDQRKGIFL